MKIMNLFIFSLLLNTMVFAVDFGSFSRQDEKCCELVRDALFYAYLDFAYRHDNNFPRRIGESAISGDIPASFTEEKAKKCKSYNSELKHAPTEGYMLKIIPSNNGNLGSIMARLENKEYDNYVKEQVRKVESQGHERWKHIEQVFNFYNID